jgi:hypothetical protein
MKPGPSFANSSFIIALIVVVERQLQRLYNHFAIKQFLFKIMLFIIFSMDFTLLTWAALSMHYLAARTLLLSDRRPSWLL